MMSSAKLSLDGSGVYLEEEVERLRVKVDG